MKKISKFDEFLNETLKSEREKLPKEIQNFLDGCCPLNQWDEKTWRVNPDGTIDVKGRVELLAENIKEFPVKFRHVEGIFDISWCKELRTLEGAPVSLGKDSARATFNCGNCYALTSLEHLPKSGIRILKMPFCSNIKSLKGAPKEIHNIFDIEGCTSLESLMYAPVGATRFNIKDCTSLPKEEVELAKDPRIRDLWLASGMSAKEFIVKKRGLIRGDKFGL